MSVYKNLVLISLCVCYLNNPTFSQRIWPDELSISPSDKARMRVLGRWDIWVHSSNEDSIPSWLEISSSGRGTLVGSIVGEEGSARPITEILYDRASQSYEFTIPPQWGNYYRHYLFKYENGKLRGEVGNLNETEKNNWVGTRAPELLPNEDIVWGDSIDLLKNPLENWIEIGDWEIKDNHLIHDGTGSNLISKDKFKNFKLHAEFRYGEGANSGIYLRGRYELQIADSYGLHAESHNLGGIYGFISPSSNAAKKAGEWQTYDLILNGRYIDIFLNNVNVVCNREIPGITGGALDSNEYLEGPIKLQGDERGRIEFRKIIIIPEKE